MTVSGPESCTGSATKPCTFSSKTYASTGTLQPHLHTLQPFSQSLPALVPAAMSDDQAKTSNTTSKPDMTNLNMPKLCLKLWCAGSHCSTAPTRQTGTSSHLLGRPRCFSDFYDDISVATSSAMRALDEAVGRHAHVAFVLRPARD